MKNLIKKAFTLIELLVVIAIIGILSGLIVVSMGGMTQKATIAKAQVFSNSFKNSLINDIIAEWRFDEGAVNSVLSLGNIIDSWADNDAVTIVGSPILREGDCVFNKCVEFNGTDASVLFGNKTAFSMGTKDYAISLWVKFNNAVASHDETMVTTGAGGGGEGYWLARVNGTSRINLGFNDGAGEIAGALSPSGSLVANSWYNVVVIFDRDGAAQAYINGAKQSEALNISTRATTVSNARALEIGAYGSGNRLVGRMDEVRLFSSIPSVSQVKGQYYMGLNNLLKNGGISKEEYLSRVNELATK